MRGPLVRVAPVLIIMVAGSPMLLASCHSKGFFRREVRGLEGVREARLLARFGQPESEGSWTIGQFAAMYEPHTPELRALALYPPGIPENREVVVRAISWQRGRILLTAFMHHRRGQWIAFYVQEWNMDVME